MIACSVAATFYLRNLPANQPVPIEEDAPLVADIRFYQCGLLRGSFVPEPPQRDLRELTRQRRQLIQAKSALAGGAKGPRGGQSHVVGE